MNEEREPTVVSVEPDTELLALSKEDLVDLVLSMRRDIEALHGRLDAILALEES